MTRLQPVTRIRSRFRQGIPIAFGAAALVAISLSPGSAQAYVVTVGGIQYDVTTFTGKYNDYISKFALPANGGVMPWFGNSTTAAAFASAVGASLLTPNPGNLGPLFAYQYYNSGSGAQSGLQNKAFNGTAVIDNGSTNINLANNPQDVRTWAQVAPPPTPTPGPLPALGAAAAFGFSRKLRKRIQEPSQPLGAGRPLA